MSSQNRVTKWMKPNRHPDCIETRHSKRHLWGSHCDGYPACVPEEDQPMTKWMKPNRDPRAGAHAERHLRDVACGAPPSCEPEEDQPMTEHVKIMLGNLQTLVLHAGNGLATVRELQAFAEQAATRFGAEAPVRFHEYGLHVAHIEGDQDALPRIDWSGMLS